MASFYIDEQKRFNRVCMLKEMVSEAPLYHSPAPLLQSQLAELRLLTRLLLSEVEVMEKVTANAVERGTK